MKKKFLVLVLGLVALLFAGATFVFYRAPKKAQPPVEPQAEKTIGRVTVAILPGNGEADSFEFDFEEGQTAYSLLKKLESEGKIQITEKEYDFGTFVESINGLENSDEMAWIYFVNDKSGNVGADQYQLEAGDLVDWRYIKPEM